MTRPNGPLATIKHFSLLSATRRQGGEQVTGSKMLSIALPNGSLEEGTLKLFEEANLKVLPRSPPAWRQIEDPRISRVTLMRPQHIPRLVEQGTYDLGVCGEDCIQSDAKSFDSPENSPTARGRWAASRRRWSARRRHNGSAGRVPPGSAILSEISRMDNALFREARHSGYGRIFLWRHRSPHSW